MRLPEVFESADNRYRVERYLGEGGSGRVYLVVCQEDSCCYALKVSADMGDTWQGLSGDVLYQGKNIADADGQEIVSGREVF